MDNVDEVCCYDYAVAISSTVLCDLHVIPFLEVGQ
jgi:hypothetical protein